MLREMQTQSTQYETCEIIQMKNNNRNELYDKLSNGINSNEKHLNVKQNEIYYKPLGDKNDPHFKLNDG